VAILHPLPFPSASSGKSDILTSTRERALASRYTHRSIEVAITTPSVALWMLPFHPHMSRRYRLFRKRVRFFRLHGVTWQSHNALDGHSIRRLRRPLYNISTTTTSIKTHPLYFACITSCPGCSNCPPLFPRSPKRNHHPPLQPSARVPHIDQYHILARCAVIVCIEQRVHGWAGDKHQGCDV
jgi:hypothetical protein